MLSGYEAIKRRLLAVTSVRICDGGLRNCTRDRAKRGGREL